MKAVMVLSCKGGTGKTTVALNIAKAMAEKYKIGIIDADISSPNLTEVIGIDDNIEIDPINRKFIPLDWDGIQVLSMYNLIGRGKAVTKSSVEVSQIIEDFILNTKWRKNDYFIIDMPAGSDLDIIDTIKKLFGKKIVGSVVVTLPNTLRDVERVIDMLRNHAVRLIGIVENMSYVTCSKCKNRIYLFGKDTTKKFCEENNYPFLGCIPYRKQLIKVDDTIKNIVSKIDEIGEKL